MAFPLFFYHQRERWLVHCGFISRLKSDINAFYVEYLLFHCIDKKGQIIDPVIQGEFFYWSALKNEEVSDYM